MNISSKQQLLLYIKNNYKPNQAIIQKDLYKRFNEMNPVTIRQSLLRLVNENLLVKSNTVQGTFFLPNESRLLDVDTLDFNELIEQKYLFNNNKERMGYISGFQLANRLGLTSQTSNVYYIMSNAVSDRKRRIKVGNRRIVLDRSRFEVNDNNYKFLQVLDIISDHNKYVEHPMEKALEIFKEYLSDISLTRTERDNILSKYPLKTQLNFFKMEVDHVITSK